MSYFSKNHSKFIIKYHIIFVVKYRKNIISKNISNSIKTICKQIENNSDFSIDMIETDKNHVHLLVNSSPKLSPLMIIRKLKQETTFQLWKKYKNFLSQHFWKEKTFWNDGYFICTTGEISTKNIYNYIKNQ